MTKDETIRILAYLREIYPNGKQVTDMTVTVWHDLLQEYRYEVVQAVTKQVAKEYTGYTMPPPAEIIKRINLIKGKGNTAIEYWRQAEQAIRRGAILTEEEFKQLPTPVQKYFGGRSAIRDIAILDQSELPNERARFLNNIKIIITREESRVELPDKVITMIDGLTDRLKLKGEVNENV